MTEPAAARHGSDSSTQRAAEPMMLERLGIDLGCRLVGKEIEGMRIDGVSCSPPILAEAWAHVGKSRSGQRHKVMNDAFKLLHARSMLNRQGCRQPRLILAFADSRAAAPFRGQGWRAQALTAAGIEVRVVDLPEGVREDIRRAQKAQKKAMAQASEADGNARR